MLEHGWLEWCAATHFPHAQLAVSQFFAIPQLWNQAFNKWNKCHSNLFFAPRLRKWLWSDCTEISKFKPSPSQHKMWIINSLTRSYIILHTETVAWSSWPPSRWSNSLAVERDHLAPSTIASSSAGDTDQRKSSQVPRSHFFEDWVGEVGTLLHSAWLIEWLIAFSGSLKWPQVSLTLWSG